MRHAPDATTTNSHATYWKRTRWLTMLLLFVCVAVTFCVVFFARSLSNFSLFGWSFSYYMAAQGTLLIYLIIIAFYNWGMAQLDKTVTSGEDNNDK